MAMAKVMVVLVLVLGLGLKVVRRFSVFFLFLCVGSENTPYRNTGLMSFLSLSVGNRNSLTANDASLCVALRIVASTASDDASYLARLVVV